MPGSPPATGSSHTEQRTLLGAPGRAALRSSSGAPQALPLASVSPSSLGSRLRKTLLVTTEGMQACTKGILRILHGSLCMQRSQRYSSFRGIQSKKLSQ